MIGVAMSLAVLAAVITVAVRRWQKLRDMRQRPGATIDRAIAVAGFDEIDAAIAGRVCWCGGSFVESGETSRTIDTRRFRIVRLVCAECERDELMYFDVTAVFH
jgi:hypothetical protein